MALAPDFFARLAAAYGDPSAFSELVFGTPLHAGQQRYCKDSNAEVNFLLPGNSYGKTELIARYATYKAWYKDGPYRPLSFEDWVAQEYKGLVCSYNYPIAKESFDRLENYLRSREELRVLVKRVNRSDPVQVELNNGAVIDWGSLHDDGKLVEAARRRFIFVDEAGHIPDLADTFDNILFPRTMGVGGSVHLFGTPKAWSDPYLLEVFEKGKDGSDPFYYSQPGDVFENEFWPQEERERVLNNPRYVKGYDKDGNPICTPIGRQVIYGHFVITGGYFFGRPHVARMFTGDYPDVEWQDDNTFYVPPRAGRLYLAAFDLAGNRKRRKRKQGSDATVGFIVDYTERPWRIVGYIYIEAGSMDWQEKYEVMAKVFHDYPMPYLLIDATGQIDSVQEALQSRGVEVEGIHFGGSSSKKYDMLRNLQLCTELEWGGTKGVLRSPLIPKLKHELDHYVLPDDDIEQDCVMALAMVAFHISQWELPAAVGGEVY